LLNMFQKNFNTGLLAATPSPYGEDISGYLSHVELLGREFSSETRVILQKIKDDRISFYQFRDIPVTEEVPPTATRYSSEIPKKAFQSEGVIGAVSIELGRLFNYRETSGFIMHDIYPAKGYEHSRSFVSSRKMLSFHTDGSAHPELIPDYVLLYCVRSDRKAANLVVDLNILLGHLSAEVVNILMRPLFRHLVSESPEHYTLQPVLFREGGLVTVRYDEDNTSGINDEAKLSQQLLDEVIRKVAARIPNYSNSLLVLNNQRCLHARTSFSPKFDGEDRWIKCTYVTRKNIKSGSIIGLSLQ
jgi:L-asparagine oxygenase